MLGTFSEVTSLLRVTVSLARVTDLETFFLKSKAQRTCIGGTCSRGACTEASTYSRDT